MFTGEYRHTVDDKGRLAVPVRFRAELAQGGQVSNWMDGCVALHPNDEWDDARRADRRPAVHRQAGRGRFRACSTARPSRSRSIARVGSCCRRRFANHAGLEAEVVLVGAGNRIELWSPERWSKFSEQMDQPEALAESLQGLGI